MYVVLYRGDPPLFFSLLLVLELGLELFDGVLTPGVFHAQMPFRLVSCGRLRATERSDQHTSSIRRGS